MEIHQHSHTPDADNHRGRKKWTHYFWEFLMLFLAVTLGFFVENQREHYVEKLRAKQFAKTLVEDLAADTVELLDVIKEDNIILSCFDSINATVQNAIKNKIVPGRFYFYSNIGTFSPTVVWHTATLTQITQTGSLRYFRNAELVKKLSTYYANIDFISGLNSGDVRYRDESIKIRGRILNSYYYSKYSAFKLSDWLKIPDSLLSCKLPLQTYEPLLLNEFANSFETRRRVLNMMISRNYRTALNEATALIGILKKEYHIK